MRIELWLPPQRQCASPLSQQVLLLFLLSEKKPKKKKQTHCINFISSSFASLLVIPIPESVANLQSEL
jgi:hypothetical protein